MNVFAVIAARNESLVPLQSAVESKFASNFIRGGDAIWFVAGVGTAVETSRQLGVYNGTDGDLKYVFVLTVTSYWGSAETTTWEWIRTRLEAKQNG
jgi:hypothetical protein